MVANILIMNKTVIFTIAIHGLDYFKYTLPTIEKYAQKIGSDFFVLDKPVIDFYDLHYEKYYIIELLKKYERVLHLDADIIVTPHARNIFDLFPYKDAVYAFNENGYGEMDRDMFVESILTDDIIWQEENDKYVYFNAGVVLVSNSNKDIFNDFRNIQFDKSIGLSSQTLLNYFVAKNKVPFEDIGCYFNRMFLGQSDSKNNRYKADFIHYAGDDKCMGNSKIETIKNDYKYFYNEIL
jgi:lipopolysaccharide biosynthesis glycosyltransferase